MYSKNAGGRASDKVWITIWGKYLPCFWSQPWPPRRNQGLGPGPGLRVTSGDVCHEHLPGGKIPVPMKSLGSPRGVPIPQPQPLTCQLCSGCLICKVGVE